MPFLRPSLKNLVMRAQADMNSRLQDGDARLSVATLKVLAFVNGGSVDGLYGYIDYLSNQFLPDRCDEDWLLRHSNIWKVPRKAAAPATGTITVVANDVATVDVGTLWQRIDGARFLTTSAVDLTGGMSQSVGVVAAAAGTAGNTAGGTQLQLVSSIEGLRNVATVDVAGIGDGAELELVDSWRARILSRIQQPPSGGTANDYMTWALEVPGVTRAWCYPGEMGPNTVTIRFVRDNDVGGLIPDVAAVAAVQAYIDARKPVTVEAIVVAPIAAPIDFQILGVLPSSDAVKAAIKAELADLLRREAIPSGTVLWSHMNASISAAAGEDDHSLVVPAGNVVNAVGRISTMGVTSWI